MSGTEREIFKTMIELLSEDAFNEVLYQLKYMENLQLADMHTEVTRDGVVGNTTDRNITAIQIILRIATSVAN